MSVEISDDEFEELVDKSLELIPEALINRIENTVILIDDYNEEDPTILGLYQGEAMTEQTYFGAFQPNTITIYRESLKDWCETREQLEEEVAITVVHEIAHHFGIDDARLHELGWR
ncbi:metallopeptidase family protein [Corynebacterium glucuronolyticum]|uniref:metallopeptidase family protein n=1 Tax=Corynebacterium glucuronolyticum TaxID=39791 RepID=UPI00223BD612|nr:metallopeptidase family protein [Corynebacterium glucuronolyticum]MCT1443044.1 metallopeptidase family protein [Corynebacterium glucuronolyticum]